MNSTGIRFTGSAGPLSSSLSIRDGTTSNNRLDGLYYRHKTIETEPLEVQLTLKRVPKLLWAQVHTRNTVAHRIVACLPQVTLDRPIFILGLPRSGTSIFCTLMGSNSNLAHWSEAPVVWDPKWRAADNEHRWTAEQCTPRAIRRISNNFSYYTKWKGCSRFINKHPRNALRVPFLTAGWPDAKLIHIRRDPRAVANSLYSITKREKHRHRFPLGGFARPPGWREIDAIPDLMERFARMTQAIHEVLREDLRTVVNPGQLFEVSYEEFGSDCHGTLRRAYEFAQVPIDEAALKKVPETLENRNYKWAATRTADEIRTMHRILSPIVVQEGYEPDDFWIDRVLQERK